MHLDFTVTYNVAMTPEEFRVVTQALHAVKRPAWNHTREDSPATPCDECAALAKIDGGVAETLYKKLI